MTEHLRTSWRFFRAWLANPRQVGAVAPSAPAMAAKLASIVRPDMGLPILELGPGTGVVTREILKRGAKARDLVAVESSEIFVKALQRNFPGVRIVQGDAFEIATMARDKRMGPFSAVVSSLPLLTTPVPERVRLFEDLFDLMVPGGPLMQFSYMLAPPVPATGTSFTVRRFATHVRNIPPARLWLYRRQAGARRQSVAA